MDHLAKFGKMEHQTLSLLPFSASLDFATNRYQPLTIG
jgi:hypothetical protein